MRKLLLFGNGLGRSLDNDYFSLARALQHAWDSPDALSDAQKLLINKCLPGDLIESSLSIAPKSEAELDRLQVVLACCDEIRKYEASNGPSWLTAEGRQFPEAIRSYIHHAASYFHESPCALPSSFSGPLKSFILSSRSHVATLNYDELLYRAFVNTDIFRRFECLIDGFVPDFNKANLERNYPQRQAFYLHLHGSPLYYSAPADGSLLKGSMSSIRRLKGHSSTHLVLTHVKHKATVINASPILKEYWSRLEEAMKEVEGIVIFGYGGGDDHLNDLIREYFLGKQVEVVERVYAPDIPGNPGYSRYAFWEERIGISPLIWSLENILSHSWWDYVHKA